MGREVKHLKRLKKLVFSLTAAVVLLGAGLAAAYTAGGRGAEAFSGEGSAESCDMLVNSSVENSKALFDSRVTDFDDTASVAKLMDVMKLDSAVGKYTVKIYNRDGLDIMRLDIENAVRESDKAEFDSTVEIYAQQLMALVEGIDEVEWVCPVTSDGSPEETMTGSLSAADASEILGADVKSFGTSSSELHKLLMKQAES